MMRIIICVCSFIYRSQKIMADSDEIDMLMAEMDADQLEMLDHYDHPPPEDENTDPVPPAALQKSSKPSPAPEKPTQYSAFKDLVLAKDAIVSKDATHVMLDSGRLLQSYKGKWTFGGKLALKDREALFKAVVKDHDKGIMHPLVETFPATTRLALDWDFKTAEPLTEETKLQ